MLHTQLENSGA